VPSDRPTVLQIIPRLDTGGAELAVLEITEALVAAGARALVASEGGRLAAEVTRLGGELIEFPAATKNPWQMYANAARLEALIREEHIDLVHARSRAPAWSALLATRRARRPFVTTYHGAYGERGRLIRLYNSVMARADVAVANSQYTGKLIEERYGTSRQKIRVIHRGVDFTKFDSDKIDEARLAALRAAWGIGDDERVVLNAARLTGWKGQRVLIDAAAKLARQSSLDNWVVILAGDAQGRDAYDAELRARIESSGLDGQVRLVGHCADMPTAFLLAHVTVVASTEPEAFGRAATEAQAMACPVIATRIGAPPETVRAEPKVASTDITGWLVPAADAEALSSCLRAALELSPAARMAIGQRAQSHVKENFSVVGMKKSTLAVYDELLGTALRETLA